MSKKGEYSKYIKEQNLILYNSNYALYKKYNNVSTIVYYYTPMVRGLELTPEVRKASMWNIDKFVYVDKYTVADMFGLVDQSYQYQHKHGFIKIKWERLLNTYRFLVNEFQKSTGRPIGFYREFFKKSTNVKDEAKIADYLDIEAILYLANELFNTNAALFRKDLNHEIVNSYYYHIGYQNLSKVSPFARRIEDIINFAVQNEEIELQRGV